MTILFAGGEDVDFTITGSYSDVLTAGLYRSSFARCALTLGAPVADPPVNRAAAALASAQSQFWFHAQWAIGSLLTTSNAQMIRFMDGSTCRLIVRGTGTNQTFKISTRTAAGVITDLVTSSAATYTASTAVALDIFINYAVAGQITLY